MKTWLASLCSWTKLSLATHGRRKSADRVARRPRTIERFEDRCVLSADFGSAVAIGSALGDSVQDLTLDGSGNASVLGRFLGVVDFDPGEGVYELTSRQDASGAYVSDTFAAKYGPDGNLLWATRLAGNAANLGPEIAAASDGSVYVTGSFTGTADFGAVTLGPSVVEDGPFGENDPFVAKLDADGNLLWARQLAGTFGNGVAVDGAGSVYVMAEHQVGSTPDAIITKLDADGTVAWTYTAGHSTSGRQGGWARGLKIDVGSAGDIYATGRMRGSVDFDPTAGTTKVSGDAFVVKLNPAGNLVWARSFSGNGVHPGDIAVDDAGNVYTAGSYFGSVDFDPGKGKFTLPWIEGYEIYVSKLDANGNFAWAKSAAGAGNQFPEALTLDAAGDLYITGDFEGTVDFNPAPATANLTSAGGRDAFVWKLTSSGAFAWIAGLGGSLSDIGRGIGVDAAGNVYTAGVFNDTADFDPGPNTYNLTSAGGNDIFMSKLVQTASPAAAAALVATAPDGPGAGHAFTLPSRHARSGIATHRPLRMGSTGDGLAGQRHPSAPLDSSTVDEVMNRFRHLRARRSADSSVTLRALESV